MRIIGLMACAANGVIGKNGKLPWNYPDEYKHFLDTIGQSPIIVGRKSFEDCPDSLLQNRKVIIFSRKNNQPFSKNMMWVSSIEELLALEINDPIIYMIGGGEIAKLFLEHNLISEFVLTIMNKEYSGDAFFPLDLIQQYPRTVVKITPDYIIYKYKTI